METHTLEPLEPPYCERAVVFRQAAVSAKVVATQPTLLRQLRQAAGLSQASLAKLGGCSQGYVSQLETGIIREPGPLVSDKLMAALLAAADFSRLPDHVAAELRQIYPNSGRNNQHRGISA